MRHREVVDRSAGDGGSTAGRRWSGPRLAMALLAFALLITPAVLSGARHGHALPAIAALPIAAANSCLEMPEPDTALCVCAAVAQAAVRHPAPPLPLLAMVTLVSTVVRRVRAPRYYSDGWWPPDRRRAFLQVFLI